MDSTKQRLMDSLYNQCQIRTRTSRQVFDGVVKDLAIYGTSHIVDQCLDIIRPYKNTGAQLESTVDALAELMFPKKIEKVVVETPDEGHWDPHSP